MRAWKGFVKADSIERGRNSCEDCADENCGANRDRRGDCRRDLFCDDWARPFYDLLDFFYEMIGAIAGGYLKISRGYLTFFAPHAYKGEFSDSGPKSWRPA
jgi:hypothetical protein